MFLSSDEASTLRRVVLRSHSVVFCAELMRKRPPSDRRSGAGARDLLAAATRFCSLPLGEGMIQR